eukprot:gene16055-biopygen8419
MLKDGLPERRRTELEGRRAECRGTIFRKDGMPDDEGRNPEGRRNEYWKTILLLKSSLMNEGLCLDGRMEIRAAHGQLCRRAARCAGARIAAPAAKRGAGARRRHEPDSAEHAARSLHSPRRGPAAGRGEGGRRRAADRRFAARGWRCGRGLELWRAARLKNGRESARGCRGSAPRIPCAFRKAGDVILGSQLGPPRSVRHGSATEALRKRHGRRMDPLTTLAQPLPKLLPSSPNPPPTSSQPSSKPFPNIPRLPGSLHVSPCRASMPHARQLLGSQAKGNSNPLPELSQHFFDFGSSGAGVLVVLAVGGVGGYTKERTSGNMRGAQQQSLELGRPPSPKYPPCRWALPCTDPSGPSLWGSLPFWEMSVRPAADSLFHS